MVDRREKKRRGQVVGQSDENGDLPLSSKGNLVECEEIQY